SSPRHPSLTLFPYTTLFRSGLIQSLLDACGVVAVAGRDAHDLGYVGQRDLAVFVSRVAVVGDAVLLVVRDVGEHAVGIEDPARRSEEHTSELQSRRDLVCRL